MFLALYLVSIAIRYDSGRVYSLPLNQQRRMRYIVKDHLNLTNFPSEKLNVSSVCLPPSSIDKIDQTNKINDKYSFILEQHLSLKLAKFHSQHFNSLVTASSSAASSVTVLKDFSCTVSASPYETTSSSYFDGTHEMAMSPLKFYCLRKPQQATVAPLSNPPSSKILAPDGK